MPKQGFGHAGFGPSQGNYGQPGPQQPPQSQQPHGVGPAQPNRSNHNRPPDQYDSRPQPPKKSRSMLPGCLISILVAVVVILGAAEFGTRWVLNSTVKQAMVETAKTEGVDINRDDAEVTFGRSSVLLGFTQRELGTVNVKTPSTLKLENDAQGTPKMTGTPKMDIKIKDLGIKNLDDPTFGELDLNLLMSDQNLQDMMVASAAESDLGAAGKLIEVTDVTSDQGQGTVDVELTGGLATITFKPTVKDGQLLMDVENVNVVGISLGEEVAKALGDEFSKNAAQLNNGLKFTDVQVESGQLAVSLHGTDLTLSQIQS